ncbi:MAG: DUF3048 domain-containing protein [Lachnospiraceae bacterium]|nr:DUF3048 domain-containing protein [Lachnospiraceae bacterium]
MKKGKKAAALLMAGMMLTISVWGCSSSEEAPPVIADTGSAPQTSNSAAAETTVEEPQEPAKAEIPAGMYRNELTGLPIDEALKNQRPIAVMVDNEVTALDHFGIAEADVLYEMINSTANDRITRLMPIYKDWKSVDQIGNIRSARSTNMMVYPEYDAVLMHAGGPFYINEFLNTGYNPRINGDFTRIPNGKPSEFTLYIKNSVKSLEGLFQTYNLPEEYTEHHTAGDHFVFAEYGEEIDQAGEGWKEAQVADLSVPFKHNKSRLVYNEDTTSYDYEEYGRLHVDADDDEVATYENVFLIRASMSQLDPNGYMVYNIYLGEPAEAYYLTNGMVKEIYWQKASATDPIKFFEKSGTTYTPLTINNGKSYIGIIPSDYWDGITIE